MTPNAPYGLISLPLVGGVDTRTEQKQVVPPKLLTCTNAEFLAPGRITKRVGTAQLVNDPSASSTSGFMVKHGNSLAMIGGTQSYKLDPLSKSWTPAIQGNTGYLNPTTISVSSVNADTSWIDVNNTDQATWGNYRAVVVGTGTSHSVNVYDATTGAKLLNRPFAVSFRKPRLFGVAGYLFIFTLDTGTTRVQVDILDVSRAIAQSLTYASASARFTLAADLSGVAAVYDVCTTTSGRFALAYNSATAGTVKVIYVDYAGTVDGAVTSLATGAGVSLAAVSICCDPNGLLGIVAYDNTTLRPSFWILNADKSANTTAANAVVGGFGAPTVNYVTAAFTAAGQLATYFEANAAATYNRSIVCTTLATGGAPFFLAIKQHANLASRAASAQGSAWVVLGYSSTLQNTFFLYRGTNLSLLGLSGRFLSGVGGGVVAEYLPNLQGVTASRLAFPALNYSSDSTQTQRISTAVDIDLAPTSLPTINVGPNLYMFGGLPTIYDQEWWTEEGFCIFPENSTAASFNAAGLLLPLTGYSYLVTFDYLNAAGIRINSTRAAAVTITTGAADNEVRVTAPTLTHTMRTANAGPGVARVSLYRATQGGTNYHYVTSVNNDITVATVLLTDDLSEAQLAAKPLLDTSSLDPVPSPNCSIIASGNSRIYLAGLDNPDRVLASLLIDGPTVTFNDALTIAIPSGSGPITALAVFRDELIVFRRNAMYSVAGDGPDNTGAGGTFATPRTISNAIGCDNPRSLALDANGLYFQSERGIYLLGQDGSLLYVGADVEAYNAEPITSAVALEDRNQIRFQTAQRTLVYDTLQRAWSVWTIAGTCGLLYQGRYTYLQANGDVRQETPGVYTDAGVPYSLVLETPWMHLAGMQGVQRVRRVLFLGDQRGPHKPSIWLAYNYENFYEDRQTWDPATVIGAQLLGGSGGLLGGNKVYGGNDAAGRPSTNVYQFRTFPARPRCQSIKVRIEDTARPGVDLGDGYALSEIAFEVQLKPGTFKVGADRVTG